MSDRQARRARQSLDKGRMEAFSDGVFAFAITLLVLDFAIHPPGSALDQVARIWPSFVAYLISFLTVGAAWLGHTALTDRLARSDWILLRLNLLLLLVVTFLPFPTRLVGAALRHPSSERVFVTLYGLTLLAILLVGASLLAYAEREHLFAANGDDEEQRERQPLLPVVAAYTIAILLGLAFPLDRVPVRQGGVRVPAGGAFTRRSSTQRRIARATWSSRALRRRRRTGSGSADLTYVKKPPIRREKTSSTAARNR
jgi:uncharacterized membrane protein